MGDEERAALGMILRNQLEMLRLLSDAVGLTLEPKFTETDTMIWDAFEADHSGEDPDADT